MATYYIDLTEGKSENDGLSEKTPAKNVMELNVLPGDTVLFKRGTFYRGSMDVVWGEKGNVITYGAYGEGENPTFCGSLDFSSPDLWVEEKENIWRYVGDETDEPCNLIFNYGESCGNLRWDFADLKNQGEWFDADLDNKNFRKYKRLSRYEWEEKPIPEGYKRPLYIYSVGNPGKVYTHIECALYGKFALCWANYAKICDINFINSGVHAIKGDFGLTVERCEFHFLGGAVFSRGQRIRLGNGVEAWQHMGDITVRDCLFNNIYDSCITHQGFAGTTPAKGICYEHNLFMNYGMAAYEVRDNIPIDAHFTDNICINAGGGFSHQGEEEPRMSEIWPFPMGHHIFLWRMAKKTEHPDAGLEIKRNIFHNAKVGAAIFSFILKAPESQLLIDENIYYTESENLLNRFGDRSYAPSDFELFKAETGLEKSGKYEKTDIRKAVNQWLSECGKGELTERQIKYYGI